MDRPGESEKVKQAVLSIALLISLACIGGSTPQVHASAAAVTLNNAFYGTLGNYNVVEANLTCNWSAPLDLVVFAIWKNGVGQTVAVTAGGVALASGATGASFAPRLGELPSGSYFVGVFVVTTTNNPVSSTLVFSVNI